MVPWGGFDPNMRPGLGESGATPPQSFVASSWPCSRLAQRVDVGGQGVPESMRMPAYGSAACQILLVPPRGVLFLSQLLRGSHGAGTGPALDGTGRAAGSRKLNASAIRGNGPGEVDAVLGQRNIRARLGHNAGQVDGIPINRSCS